MQGGSLIFDSLGNLYGTTQVGGIHEKGVVFELSPGLDGAWGEKVIHNFNGANGANPYSALIMDHAGNLYSEAYTGGDGNCGLVFKLAPTTGESWTYSVLRSFHGPDGCNPRYGLVFDSAGNIYGTTQSGGTYGNGVVFEIMP